MDLKDLLGHKSSNITRHYSSPDIDRLMTAAERVVKLRIDPALRVVGKRGFEVIPKELVPQISHRSSHFRPTMDVSD